jgi:pSer/pThr/pTyr-binding forkhead associated (FHA) protein
MGVLEKIAPVAGAALAAGAAVIAANAITNKIEEKREQENVAAAQASGGIRGTSGKYAGQSFNVSGSLRIGRNSQANIIYPDGTPGISSMHCEISNNGGVLSLTDKGSSNGTFLNGQRISVGTPYTLNPGDSFYLGSSQNSFTVY